MLTESQVEKSFRSLISKTQLAEDDFEKADDLLENLRAESPLLHRLSAELEELRALSTADNS